MSEQERPIDSALTREAILAALLALSDELAKQSVIGEICLFGGAVMVLAFTARISTKDVLDLVGRYYPASRIPVKTQYLVEGLFAEGQI